MAPVIKLIFFMFLFFITIAEGEKKKEKIVIHVPYKIHKHHHTHTKYKIIAVPQPKKENTVIYLKEEIQPIIKHVAPVQIHTEVIPTISKKPQPFIPPHQESSSALLASLANHKEQDIVQTEDQQQQQQQQYSTVIENQKPVESHKDQTPNELVPNFTYNPIILSPQNILPHYPFKPLIISPQHDYTPKLLLTPGTHNYNTGLIPKLTYPAFVPLPQSYYNPKLQYKTKPMHPNKNLLHDNEAHSSSHVYKTIINPREKIKPYKVREEQQESNNKFMKHQKQILKTVPSMKSNRKGKMYFQPGHQLKDIENMIPSDSEYEYEHIGYLIIDGNSRKAVGKNFKDPLNLSI